MTLERSIFAAIILACLAFGAIAWEESRAARASLEKAIAIQQQIIDAAETREQSRDANLKTTLSQIAAANKSVQTPRQIVTALQQLLSLPKPITLGTSSVIEQLNPGGAIQKSTIGNVSKPGAVAAAPDPKNGSAAPYPSPFGPPEVEATDSGKSRTLPPKQSGPLKPSLKSAIRDFFTLKSRPSPDVATSQPDGSIPFANDPHLASSPNQAAAIPTADLRPLFDKIQSCRSCETQLAVSQADLSDEKTRSAALTKERDAALTSAKGGTFWHRLKQNAKWLAIGAAVGATAIRVRQH